MTENNIFENESILELSADELESIVGGKSATLKVKHGELNVYSGPGKGYNVIAVVDKDDTLTCVGVAEKGKDGKTWIKVKVYGKTGWVRGDKVK